MPSLTASSVPGWATATSTTPCSTPLAKASKMPDRLRRRRDLNPQKARVLLMLALTQSKDPAQIQRWFQQF